MESLLRQGHLWAVAVARGQKVTETCTQVEQDCKQTLAMALGIGLQAHSGARRQGHRCGRHALTGRSKKAGAACASAAVPASQSSRPTYHCWEVLRPWPRVRRRCRNMWSRCRGRSASVHAMSSAITASSLACSQGRRIIKCHSAGPIGGRVHGGRKQACERNCLSCL
jgi:hypothetical protein